MSDRVIMPFMTSDQFLEASRLVKDKCSGVLDYTIRFGLRFHDVHAVVRKSRPDTVEKLKRLNVRVRTMSTQGDTN